MTTLPEIDSQELNMLCWLDWYDGPLSGLITWQGNIFWFRYEDRWGVDEELDIWEDDWGYIYQMFPLSDQQIQEAIRWFKAKGEWLALPRAERIANMLEDWDGPVLSVEPVATFNDKQNIPGYSGHNYALPADFQYPLVENKE